MNNCVNVIHNNIMSFFLKVMLSWTRGPYLKSEMDQKLQSEEFRKDAPSNLFLCRQ